MSCGSTSACGVGATKTRGRSVGAIGDLISDRAVNNVEGGTSKPQRDPPASIVLMTTTPTTALDCRVTAPPATERTDGVEATPQGLSRLRTFESLRVPAFRWFLVSTMALGGGMMMQLLVTGYVVFVLTGSYAALGTVAPRRRRRGVVAQHVGRRARRPIAEEACHPGWTGGVGVCCHLSWRCCYRWTCSCSGT